jgi:hypothetical protein
MASFAYVDVAYDKVFGWFWPFSATPDRSTSLEFEVNGFEGALILFLSNKLPN